MTLGMAIYKLSISIFYEANHQVVKRPSEVSLFVKILSFVELSWFFRMKPVEVKKSFSISLPIGIWGGSMWPFSIISHNSSRSLTRNFYPELFLLAMLRNKTSFLRRSSCKAEKLARHHLKSYPWDRWWFLINIFKEMGQPGSFQTHFTELFFSFCRRIKSSAVWKNCKCWIQFENGICSSRSSSSSSKDEAGLFYFSAGREFQFSECLFFFSKHHVENIRTHTRERGMNRMGVERKVAPVSRKHLIYFLPWYLRLSSSVRWDEDIRNECPWLTENKLF